MKQITKMSRLTGQLEKLYRMLNEDFFESQLSTPIITVQSTPRAYGHVTVHNAWSVKGNGVKELNIAAGTLYRPIENTVATMLHEMVHIYNLEIAKVNDTSRNGTYHNATFKAAAEAHGLICTRSDVYGYSDTSSQLSDELIEWVLTNGISDIELYRDELPALRIATGSKAGNTNTSTSTTPRTTNTHSRKYKCPCCGNSARATKQIKLICGDCIVPMIEC